VSDNVVKFRRPEKKPEPPVNKPRAPMPAWAPFAAFFGIALIIFFAQRAGILG
jgi:hypothetical protein